MIGTYDRILMNPPFANGADIKHILHAIELLKPGGRLVAICADGPRQRDRLGPLAMLWIQLPHDTFADSGSAPR
jgi:16S rRNA G1207 methylase RsmC